MSTASPATSPGWPRRWPPEHLRSGRPPVTGGAIRLHQLANLRRFAIDVDAPGGNPFLHFAARANARFGQHLFVFGAHIRRRDGRLVIGRDRNRPQLQRKRHRNIVRLVRNGVAGAGPGLVARVPVRRHRRAQPRRLLARRSAGGRGPHRPQDEIRTQVEGPNIIYRVAFGALTALAERGPSTWHPVVPGTAGILFPS